MVSLLTLLVVLLVGWHAYARARAEGTWSWKLFFLVLLGAAVILGVSIPLLLISGDALNAGHTLAGTAGIVCAALFTISGIVLLVVWTKPRKGR